MLSNGINSIGSSACKNLSFFKNISAKITFAFAFKTALIRCGFWGGVIRVFRTCQNFLDVFGSSERIGMLDPLGNILAKESEL